MSQNNNKWNPYYRRNPDGSPGQHDSMVRRQKGADTEQNTPTPNTPEKPSPEKPFPEPQPVPRAKPIGQPLPPNPEPRPEDIPTENTGKVRYHRGENGTFSRVYPSGRSGKPDIRTMRMLLLAAMAVLLIVVVVIGSVALFRSRGSDGITYVYDYAGQYTVKCTAEQACPFDVPYLNMNYLAAIYGMTVSGSYEDMKFSTDDGEWISFMPDSAVVMVNGNRHTMTAAALLRGQQMWLPAADVTALFTGITVRWDVETERYKHAVEVIPARSEDGKTVLSLTFALRPVETPDTPAAWDEGYHYLTDMTPYKDAITPADRDAWLILVNKENPLPSSYTPSGLVDVTHTRAGYRTQQMVETAELALQAMFQDMKAAGFTDVSVTSGYRSYATQNFLFEKYVTDEMKSGITRAEAEAKANTYSARPGESEHQTGLAVDMYNTQGATQDFALTDAFAWLSENAHQYGFILRFPEGKEAVTGYIFEPWHFRFVGRYHATAIYRSGLTLEEYLETLE